MKTKVLIIDDSLDKIETVETSIIASYGDKVTIDKARSSNAAREKLRKNKYSMAIIDLCIPVRDSGAPINNEGVNLLHEILRDNCIHKPDHIFGLTSFTDLFEQYTAEFDRNLITLLEYSNSNQEWISKIRLKLDEIIDNSLPLWKKHWGKAVATIGLVSSILGIIDYFNKS
ncbi:hypothetical protein [Halobacteriovorax sp. RT-2-6]|uniref:hypothetical protein n=1 Tax=unclassified Halobacteriovorax TaxID=2639665 RepID=UPI00399AB073